MITKDEAEKMYQDLISYRKSNPLIKDCDFLGYIETHHIVPRSCGGSNDKDNLINLLAKEHFMAHVYLYVIHHDDEFHKETNCALICMNCGSIIGRRRELQELMLLSEEYQQARIEYSKSASEKQKIRYNDPEQRKLTSEKTKLGLQNMDKERKDEMLRKQQIYRLAHIKDFKINCSWKGRHHTNKTKKKMSDFHRLHPLPKEKINGYDTSWVSNEQLRISIQVPNSMVWDYISWGYIKRRIIDWNYYIDRRTLKENHISLGHLNDIEKQLLKEHKVQEILILRQQRKIEKDKQLQIRIKEMQEMADYYMLHGFKATKEKFNGRKCLTSLECLLQSFNHYKKKYGIRFEARNNIKGQINGQWFQ